MKIIKNLSALLFFVGLLFGFAGMLFAEGESPIFLGNPETFGDLNLPVQTYVYRNILFMESYDDSGCVVWKCVKFNPNGTISNWYGLDPANQNRGARSAGRGQLQASGNRIVWEAEGDNGSGDSLRTCIINDDGSLGASANLLQGTLTYAYGDPALSGSFLAYGRAEASTGKARLFISIIGATGIERTIQVPQAFPDSSQINPVISGDVVLWREWSNTGRCWVAMACRVDANLNMLWQKEIERTVLPLCIDRVDLADDLIFLGIEDQTSGAGSKYDTYVRRFNPQTGDLLSDASNIAAFAGNCKVSRSRFLWINQNIFLKRIHSDGTFDAVPELACDTSECAEVRALSGDGNRFVFVVRAPESGVYTILIPPLAPQNLAAVQSGSDVVLTWDDMSDDETGFRIDRSTTATFDTVTSIMVNVNVHTYADPGLTGGTYYYRVVALGENNTASDSSAAATVTVVPVFSAPSNLVVTKASASKFVLTWQDNSTGETGFKIERSGDAVTFVPYATVVANVTTFTDSVNTQLMYAYRIKAINGVQETVYSNIGCAYPLASTISLATNTVAGITVSWTPVISTSSIDLADLYQVQWWYSGIIDPRTGKTTNTYVPLVNVPASQLTYMKNGLVKGKQYCFRVFGHNAHGFGRSSNVVVAVAK